MQEKLDINAAVGDHEGSAKGKDKGVVSDAHRLT